MRVAMAMEMIVGPARAPADRRTPERFAENAPDNAAGDGANRTGNDEACLPAPAAAPTQSARAFGAATVTAPSALAINTLLAKMKLRIGLPSAKTGWLSRQIAQQDQP